jgi:tetratricopeptide (TPR) repeat protein
LLLRTDEKAAYALARKLAEGDYKDNPQALNAIAWPIVDDTSNLKSPDYDTAIAIAERAAELTKSEDGMILDTLAYAHFKKGNIDKAIALQEKAVQLIEKMENVPDDAKKEIKERLEMFKKKKNEA